MTDIIRHSILNKISHHRQQYERGRLPKSYSYSCILLFIICVIIFSKSRCVHLFLPFPYITTMLSSTSTAPKLHGDLITLDMVTSKTSTKSRRTKIICTMGPACWSEVGIGILMDAGMNVARFNFSHGDHEGHGACLERLRKVAAEKCRNIAGK